LEKKDRVAEAKLMTHELKAVTGENLEEVLWRVAEVKLMRN